MFGCAVGQGIELRLLEEHHAGELFAVVDQNRERLRRWLPWVDRTATPDDTREFIHRALDQFAAHDGLHAGIWVEGMLAGGIGCRDIDWANRSTSIGYWLDAAAEGRGVVTRSCAVFLDHLFGVLELNRVEIRCAPDNTRSGAVPERLGFTREGIARCAEWRRGAFHDLVVWSLLSAEWRSPGVQ
jgi:ribosomal-protein-serine acetyltransferase